MNWKRFFAAVFALLVVFSLSSTRVTCADVNNGRHSRRGHRPERRDGSWRESFFEGRDEGQHARVHDEQRRRVPLLLAVTWTVHGNGERDGISVVQSSRECGGRPNRKHEHLTHIGSCDFDA